MSTKVIQKQQQEAFWYMVYTEKLLAELFPRLQNVIRNKICHFRIIFIFIFGFPVYQSRLFQMESEDILDCKESNSD